MTTLSELATLVSGTLVGDGDLEISSAMPIESCNTRSITFLDSSKKLERLEASSAAALVVGEEMETSRPQIIVSDIHSAFQSIVLHFRPKFQAVHEQGVSPQAKIHSSVIVGEGTTISAGASISAECRIGKNCRIHSGVHLMEQCSLGDDCELFPGVVIYPQSVLRNRVILHAGTVIGADGFGYRPVQGKHIKSAQLGWVELHDDVEVGANSCVDRGAYGPTVIGEGTKIDNFVQVGHNCQIGKHNLLCAHVGIAGSTSTGEYVVMAGQVGVRDHVRIGDHAVISAQSGVASDVEGHQSYYGTPALPRQQKLKQIIHVSRLGDTNREIKALKRRLAELEESSREQGEENSESKAA